MKKAIFILILLLNAQLFAQQYQKTGTGLKAKSQSMNIEIRFYSPSIVRVIKSPEGTTNEKQSLSVIKTPEKTELSFNESGHIITMSSSLVSVSFDCETGKVSYSDLKNNHLFTEKDYGTQFTPVMDVKKQSYLVRQAYLLDKEEAVYGLGQQQNGQLMQRGQRVVLKNENTRICIPYFLSAKGYGIFWDNYSSTTFTDNQQETSFESLGDHADYYFMYGGNASGVVVQMRDLTGQAPMLPLWTYGYWQSRERYKTQQELINVVKKYREIKVPIDGIIQDWQYWGRDSVWNAMSFNNTTFPDPKGMVDSIHNLHSHLMIVAWPGFGPLTKQYTELKSKKMLIDFDTWPPGSGTKPYDVYNPEARDIYWNYLNPGVFSFGSDAWWLDSSEPDHINVKDSDFDKPTYLGSYRSVVNAYPLLHTKGVYEHQRATTSDKRVCILTRSAFAGQQRFAANSWSGDVVSSWETLQKQVPAALNFSLCGIPYWNADIGGFFAGSYSRDGGAKNPEYQELYVRWLQFATFTPMMRSHGTDFGKEIYQFGKSGDWAYDAIKKNISLRYRLLPYLYSTAWQVTNQSASILYALPLVFNDEKIKNCKDEFMFGRSFLIAPVLTAMYTGKEGNKVIQDFSQVKTNKVYLPKESDWFDLWTGEKFKGGQEITKEIPIDITPAYIKSGTILPWGPDVQYATEKKWDNLTIRVYPGADGEFALYEDEKDNYNYEKGGYSTILMNWNEKLHTLTIGERKGNFPGMLQHRNFRIVLVDKNKGVGLNDDVTPSKIIKYSGKEVIVKL